MNPEPSKTRLAHATCMKGQYGYAEKSDTSSGRSGQTKIEPHGRIQYPMTRIQDPPLQGGNALPKARNSRTSKLGSGEQAVKS
jgi:hypothetical protein